MPKTYTFTAHIEDGRLKVGLRALQLLREAVKGWRRCPVTVTIEKQHATRSLNANAYYWGVVVAILADYTGYTPDEIHDSLKLRFLSKEVAFARGNGEVVAEFVIGGSTTALYSFEFYSYVEEIRQWAFEALDVSIPPPDPEWRAHAEQERREHEQREGLRRGSGEDAAGEAPRRQAGRAARGHRRSGNSGVGEAVDGSKSGAGAD